MNVSFTGINNVEIYKDTAPKVVKILDRAKRLKEANSEYYAVQIDCRLSDDATGKHLGELYNIYQKTKNYLSIAGKPADLCIFVEHFDINSPRGIVKKNNIKLNDNSINLEKPEDRKLLPFYTYIAKILREMVSMSDDKQVNDTLKDVNKFISTEAEHFIDYIM